MDKDMPFAAQSAAIFGEAWRLILASPLAVLLYLALMVGGAMLVDTNHWGEGADFAILAVDIGATFALTMILIVEAVPPLILILGILGSLLAGIATATEASVRLPWYIMTSPMNDAVTRAYFAERGHFGLPAADVTFFPQGTLPCLTEPGGKVILKAKGECAMAPDGNGGIYAAMEHEGVLADMAARGVNRLTRSATKAPPNSISPDPMHATSPA